MENKTFEVNKKFYLKIFDDKCEAMILDTIPVLGKEIAKIIV